MLGKIRAGANGDATGPTRVNRWMGWVSQSTGDRALALHAAHAGWIPGLILASLSSTTHAQAPPPPSHPSLWDLTLYWNCQVNKHISKALFSWFPSDWLYADWMQSLTGVLPLKKSNQPTMIANSCGESRTRPGFSQLPWLTEPSLPCTSKFYLAPLSSHLPPSPLLKNTSLTCFPGIPSSTQGLLLAWLRGHECQRSKPGRPSARSAILSLQPLPIHFPSKDNPSPDDVNHQ